MGTWHQSIPFLKMQFSSFQIVEEELINATCSLPVYILNINKVKPNYCLSSFQIYIRH